MNTANKHPGWLFYAAWIVFSTIAIPLAFSISLYILKLITHWVGDWIVIGGSQHLTEDYLLGYVFIPLIWLFSGSVQYLLFRFYLPKMGWWVLVTAAGWLLAVAILYLLYLINQALDKSGVIFSFNAITHAIVGTSIGFFQWVLLRRRLPNAGWWIAASASGWGLIALVGMPFTNLLDIFAVGFLPGITTALVLWLLLRQLPPADSAVVS